MDESRSILITGGSSGIGAATVRLAARKGYSVVFTYNNNKVAAEELRDVLVNEGQKVECVKADVGDEKQVIRLFSQAIDTLGTIDVVVISSGITGGASRLENLEKEALIDTFRVNVFGVFYCARQAINHMSTGKRGKGGKGGCIIAISSVLSRLGGSGMAIHYAASKGAIDTLTIGLAQEVAASGIRFNAVRPGVIDTLMHASLGQPNRPKEAASFVPLARAGKPEEVAESILWLASPQASYVTGAILDVSGGR